MGLWSRTKQIVTKAVPVGIAPDWLTNKAFWNAWDSEAAMREGYRSVAWVYAAVKLRANAVASVPLKVEVMQAGEWVDAPMNHPLVRLLNSPNIDIDSNEMMRTLVTHLDLAGNGYWLKTRAGNGMPVELWPMLPQYMKVIPGRDRLIKAYEYSQHGVTTFPSEDVMHSAFTNPENLYYGMSPLQAAGKAVDIDNAAASWQKISMQNRGVPDGVFSFDADMTYDQWQEVRAMVREEYTGVGSSRAPWVLSKAKYQQLAMSPVEMDYMETRKYSMQQICAVYGVPIEMINGMGDANRASGENVRRTFWIDTVTPLLTELEGSLNLGLARDFGTADQIRIRFDTSAVPALQENYTEKVQNASSLWSMGVPFNEISKRLDLGFEEIQGGEMGYISSSVIPASLDMAIDGAEPATAEQAYGAPMAQDVQRQALNGAQIQSLQTIVESVVLGQLPYESGVQLIMAAFPSLTQQDVEAILSPARNFTPSVEAAKAGEVEETKESFVPPQGVRDAAKKGLEYRSEYNRGGTAVGIARARDLSNGKGISADTIGRMVSFFARHEENRVPPSEKTEPDGGPTNGWIAWLLWGGDAGKSWSAKVMRQIEDGNADG